MNEIYFDEIFESEEKAQNEIHSFIEFHLYDYYENLILELNRLSDKISEMDEVIFMYFYVIIDDYPKVQEFAYPEVCYRKDWIDEIEMAIAYFEEKPEESKELIEMANKLLVQVQELDKKS